MAAQHVANRPPQRLHEIAYWWFALACAVAGFAVDWLDHVNPAYNGAYAIGGLIAFALVRIGVWVPTRGILLHMSYAMVVLVIESHIRFGHADPTATALGMDHQAVGSFLIIGMVGIATYGGWRWGALAFALAMAAKYHLPSRGVHAVMLAILWVFGLLFHATLEQADQARKKLEDIAFLDPLTGLPNRRAADLQFAAYRAIAARSSVPLMLMVWDLDGLKTINDRKGHRAGDAYLQEFCASLNASLRSGDAAFRTGGDEFITLHLGLVDAALVTARVRARFPNVSVGFCSDAKADLAQLVSEADHNMYQDKAARRAKRTESTALGA